jgi:hypothetical protein
MTSPIRQTWPIFVIALLAAGPGAFRGDQTFAQPSDGVLNIHLPLSAEWPNFGGRSSLGDPVVNNLVRELSQTDPVATNAWSTRTEAEFKKAVQMDPYLSNSKWKRVRCSRSGCIVAIDATNLTSAPNPQSEPTLTFKTKLLSFVTPRHGQPVHSDFCTTESYNQGEHIYYVFYYFPSVEKSP